MWVFVDMEDGQEMAKNTQETKQIRASEQMYLPMIAAGQKCLLKHALPFYKKVKWYEHPQPIYFDSQIIEISHVSWNDENMDLRIASNKRRHNIIK